MLSTVLFLYNLWWPSSTRQWCIPCFEIFYYGTHFNMRKTCICCLDPPYLNGCGAPRPASWYVQACPIRPHWPIIILGNQQPNVQWSYLYSQNATGNFELDKILNRRMRRYGSGQRYEYLVSWVGYDDFQNQWLPEVELLRGAKASVDAYNRIHLKWRVTDVRDICQTIN